MTIIFIMLTKSTSIAESFIAIVYDPGTFPLIVWRAQFSFPALTQALSPSTWSKICSYAMQCYASCHFAQSLFQNALWDLIISISVQIALHRSPVSVCLEKAAGAAHCDSGHKALQLHRWVSLCSRSPTHFWSWERNQSNFYSSGLHCNLKAFPLTFRICSCIIKTISGPYDPFGLALSPLQTHTQTHSFFSQTNPIRDLNNVPLSLVSQAHTHQHNL